MPELLDLRCLPAMSSHEVKIRKGFRIQWWDMHLETTQIHRTLNTHTGWDKVTQRRCTDIGEVPALYTPHPSIYRLGSQQRSNKED